MGRIDGKGFGAKNILTVFEPLFFSLKYISQKRWILAIVIVSSLIGALSRLLVPIYIGDSVNAVQNLNYSSVVHYTVLILIVSSVAGGVQFIVNYGSQYISQYYSYELRKDLVSHLFRKKVSFYEGQTSGDLLSRSTMDVEATRNFVMNTVSQLIPTLFTIVFAFVFLLSINLTFAGIFLVAVPILILIGIVFQKKQRTHWRNIRSYYGQMNENLQENIIANRVVRGFSAESNEIKKFSETTGRYYDEYMVVAGLRGKYNNLMPLVISVSATAILIYGGFISIIKGSDVGSLVAAVNIFNLVSFPVSFLGRLIVWGENARAGISRLHLILDSDGEESLSEKMGPNPAGELVFHNVTFARNGINILENVNLAVGKGEFLGLTGRTATGKSSLINLIPRFYEPDSGDILLGGRPITQIPLSTLRRIVSIVPQEINLLSGTIAENISFGNSSAGLESIKWAADIAQISGFVESLPDGYDTLVGERGITLSGGQKQRVAIARALLGRPDILILDDATSSVDPETELEILRGIKNELSGTTVIIVTHRESALRFADHIVLLKEGTLDTNPVGLLERGHDLTFLGSPGPGD